MVKGLFTWLASDVDGLKKGTAGRAYLLSQIADDVRYMFVTNVPEGQDGYSMVPSAHVVPAFRLQFAPGQSHSVVEAPLLQGVYAERERWRQEARSLLELLPFDPDDRYQLDAYIHATFAPVATDLLQKAKEE